jgi:hypothetical protein
MLEEQRELAVERAQQQAERQAQQMKTEFGDLVLDAVEDYFPRQAQARRRQLVARSFAIGFAAGLLVPRLLGRRLRRS